MGRLLGLGALEIVGLAALCLLVGAFLSPVWAFALALLGGLALIVVGSSIWGMELVFAGILAVSAGGVSAFFGPDWIVAVRGEAMEAVSVEDPLRHPGAVAFRFPETIRPRLDCLAVHAVTTRNRDGGSSTATYCAAPLMPVDWPFDRPLPTWVVFDGRSEAAEAGDPSWRWAMRMGEGSRDGWSAAARRSAERFGLKVHPEAVFMRWCVSPDAEIRRRGTLLFGLVGLMLAFWIVGLPLGSWFFGGEELP